MVVYEDDLFFGCADEIRYERIGIPHTACSEELFLWLLMRADEEGYFLLIQLQTVLYTQETVIYMLLEGYKLMIDGIAIQQILLKYAICPRPEEDALR